VVVCILVGDIVVASQCLGSNGNQKAAASPTALQLMTVMAAANMQQGEDYFF